MLVEAGEKILHPLLRNGEKEVFFVLEINIDTPFRNLGSLGDLGDGGFIETPFGKDFCRHFQDQPSFRLSLAGPLPGRSGTYILRGLRNDPSSSFRCYQMPRGLAGPRQN